MSYHQLFCTFSNDVSYKEDVRNIRNFYSTSIIKFFVFESTKVKKDTYITYNISAVSSFDRYRSTINIHRKKETNTLYTLNAMNRLITEENNGVFDKTHNLDWTLYKDCLILTNDVGVRIIDLKLIVIL
jgi:hypothetical protein